MSIRITQRPSKGHDDNHQQIPDTCACGEAIGIGYMKDGLFVCFYCYYGKDSK